MSQQHGPKLIDLFEKATSDDLKEPDYGLNIDIADRMNSRRRYCLEGIEYFKQLFRSTDLKTVELTLSLLETCVKNCNSHFHRYLSNREFIPSFSQLLKRRRRKLNLVEKMAGLYKNPGWRKIEDRVLCLIQLWADTFMMHEDTYPAFMKIYRELRKEGLKFPTRDPNERFMIKFEGEPSPAFELADMEQQIKGSSERDVIPRRSPPRSRAPARGLDEDEEPKLMQSDIDSLTRNLPLLEDMIARARDVRDLQEPNVKEVVRNCRSAQKKLIWVISYKASNSTDERDTIELLGIMDYINSKMDTFKNAVGVLKRGGTNKEVVEVLKGKAKDEDNLLDLGEDFLEIQEKNPLDKLEKYVWGRQAEERKIEANVEEAKNPPLEIPRIEEPPQHGRKLAPLPDLLLDEPEDYTPTPIRDQGNMYDLNSIFSQPPQGQPVYQTPGYNPQMQSQAPIRYPPNYQNQMMPGFNPQLNQGYPPQSYPQNYAQTVQAAQRDEFEDFFSEIANRR